MTTVSNTFTPERTDNRRGKKDSILVALKVLIFSIPILINVQAKEAQGNGQNMDSEVSIDYSISRFGDFEVTEVNKNKRYWVLLDVGADANGKIVVNLHEGRSKQGKLDENSAVLANRQLNVNDKDENVDGDYQIWHGGSAASLEINKGVVQGRSTNPDGNAVGILIAADDLVEGREYFDIQFVKTEGNI